MIRVIFRETNMKKMTLLGILLSIIALAGVSYAGVTGPVFVDIDIKPQSCPNPLNVKSKGVLPVAILGAEDFDVSLVDVSTLELEGVPALSDKYEFEDVASPFYDTFLNDNCFDCTEEGPDSFLDLIIYFESQQIADVISPVEDGECLYPTLTGFLTDGIRIEGSDSLRIIKKK